MVDKKTMLMRSNEQLYKLFGVNGAPAYAVQFAFHFYEKNDYYGMMQEYNVKDIEGISHLILITSAQVFLSSFDFMNGVHTLECDVLPSYTQMSKLGPKNHERLEKFLHETIKDTIYNARADQAPREWNPVALKLVNAMATETYETTMNNLKAIGHDCSNCHLYNDRKDCEIYREIPKPIGHNDL